jgi:hypothetical protein
MQLRIIVLAASMLLAPAAFSASFAQTTAVSEHSFDWIFFAIVGIPFVLVLFDTLINDGWRAGSTEGVERGYPPTVSDDFAARPISAWRNAEDPRAVGAPVGAASLPDAAAPSLPPPHLASPPPTRPTTLSP